MPPFAAVDFIDHAITAVISLLTGAFGGGGGVWMAWRKERREDQATKAKIEKEARADAIQEWVHLLTTARADVAELKKEMQQQAFRHEQDRTKWAEEHGKCLEMNAKLTGEVMTLRERLGQVEMQLERVSQKGES